MWYDYKIALSITLCKNYRALYDMIAVVSSVRFCQCEWLFDREKKKKDEEKEERDKGRRRTAEL